MKLWTPERIFLNQCDGCLRHVPLIDGSFGARHTDGKEPWFWFHCTADRYPMVHRWMSWHSMFRKMSGYVPDPDEWCEPYEPRASKQTIWRFVNGHS